jgi:Flp pilus assembly protein TadG
MVVRSDNDERGAVMVEFAIVLPVLLLILLSTVDFGRYLYVRINLSSSTFEVADAITRGLFSTTDDSNNKRSKMYAVIADVSPNLAPFAQIDPSASLELEPLPAACPNASNLVKVTISSSFKSISPFMNFFDTATSTTSMRCLR